MYLFKTSGKTFDSVIRNQKHAFSAKPRDWHPRELVLVSKNKQDCQPSEKQIQYSMRLIDFREASEQEVESCANLTEITKNKIRDEVGDITINLLNFCNILDINPIECAVDKLEIIKKKYPVDKSHGSAKKYDEL